MGPVMTCSLSDLRAKKGRRSLNALLFFVEVVITVKYPLSDISLILSHGGLATDTGVGKLGHNYFFLSWHFSDTAQIW